MRKLGTEWLNGSHKAFGRSIFAQKIAKISKGSWDRFSGNPTLLCREARFRFMIIISW